VKPTTAAVTPDAAEHWEGSVPITVVASKSSV